jgi:predicted O-methyltransferase YrrM
MSSVMYSAEPLRIEGTPDGILHRIALWHSEIPVVLANAKRACPPRKRQIAEYQGAALYAAVRPYNTRGARILEIGTFEGYSAHIMAQACPQAHITTLNPKEWEREIARVHLQGKRVTLRGDLSWDYLTRHVKYSAHLPFDVIFVDGDHAAIRRDLPWFDHIRDGGLMIFHDYSPAETPRPCPPVYDALNAMREALGREFDVLVVDNERVGMAGFIRRPEDAGWQERMK